MEAFEALPVEKRKRVVNAAMGVFAVHGYRKASVADIALEAGISKAMVFTYFGSKAGLYAYLSQLVTGVTLGAFEAAKPRLLAVTDYFERVLLSSRLKIEMLKAHPAILAFSASMFNERAAEVRPIIEELLAEAFTFRDDMLALGIDETKFKNPADAARVSKMCEWMATGAAEEWNGKSADELDGYMEIFSHCLTALKQYFYREAYV